MNSVVCHKNRTVLVYRSDLLGLSETFVLKQVAALKRWKAKFHCERVLPNGLSLEGMGRPVELPGNGSLQNFIYRMSRLLGIPYYPGVVKARKSGASLVHVHFATDAVDAWPQLRMLHVPMLVTLHGYDITTTARWWKSGKAAFRRRFYPHRLIRMANDPNVHFLAVSEFIKRRAIGFGIPGEKIIVAYTGIDTDFFRPTSMKVSQRPRRVLYVGRLVEKKGVSILVDAFSGLLATCPDAELVVAGDGPLRASLQQKAAHLGTSVRFTGSLTPVQVREEMHQARVFVLPSITAANGDSEGFGMVLLEAQASGLPVVTSALEGAHEGIVEDVTGYAFPPGDAARLQAILKDIIDDSAQLDAMSAAAIRFVNSRYSIQQCTGMLEDIYDAIAFSCRAEGTLN